MGKPGMALWEDRLWQRLDSPADFLNLSHFSTIAWMKYSAFWSGRNSIVSAGSKWAEYPHITSNNSDRVVGAIFFNCVEASRSSCCVLYKSYLLHQIESINITKKDQHFFNPCINSVTCRNISSLELWGRVCTDVTFLTHMLVRRFCHSLKRIQIKPVHGSDPCLEP